MQGGEASRVKVYGKGKEPDQVLDSLLKKRRSSENVVLLAGGATQGKKYRRVVFTKGRAQSMAAGGRGGGVEVAQRKKKTVAEGRLVPRNEEGSGAFAALAPSLWLYRRKGKKGTRNASWPLPISVPRRERG